MFLSCEGSVIARSASTPRFLRNASPLPTARNACPAPAKLTRLSLVRPEDPPSTGFWGLSWMRFRPQGPSCPAKGACLVEDHVPSFLFLGPAPAICPWPVTQGRGEDPPALLPCQRLSDRSIELSQPNPHRLTRPREVHVPGGGVPRGWEGRPEGLLLGPIPWACRPTEQTADSPGGKY
jgi:hypothetical protein